MGKYPVTNKEYCLYDLSHENPGENLPVINVKWKEALAYCQWLTNRTRKNYRLPTEAEWEYACRGGTTTEYYWGNEMDGDYCWYCDNSGGKVHLVGQKKPNDFGLYDMSGNVWECCSDYYDDKYYRSSPSSNPAGPKSGSNRIFRGGGWGTSASGCRSAYRGSGRPNYPFDFVGFRLVRSKE
jgi:formylglycine-generating enzyme required for sulfatase activity